MLSSLRSRPRLLLIALVVALVGAAVVVYVTRSTDSPVIAEQNVRIEVLDGPARDERVQLDATFYLPQRRPAPAVLLAHGFGGSKASVVADAKELAGRGFAVLAYSARGFGASTGEIALNSPDYEVADAMQLVDWLAERPEVITDAPGDPRVGVTGSSYGGALSLLLAGSDPRVDALVPVITYNDLGQALIPNSAATADTAPGTPAANAFATDGVFKRAWAGIFFAAGMGAAGLANPNAEASEPGDEDSGSTSAAAGAATDLGAATTGQSGGGGGAGRGMSVSNPCGRFRLEVCAAYAEVATTGRAGAKTVELLRSVSPVSVADRITQPTMLVQGEQDTLFGLDQADANARQIAEAGGKVKVVWYTGGHDGGRPGAELRGKMIDWLAFHLDGAGSDPGTGFEYAVQGALRAQGAPSVRTVTAAGYPGVGDTGATERRDLRLFGDTQTVVNPPGGNPASISSMPGLGSVIGSSSRLAGRISIDLPGQSARFASRPVDAQLLITGATTARVRVAALPNVPVPDGAVLFAKLYDVGPDGARTLPGSAVSALRIPALPADGTAVEVGVTLPAVVRPIEADHRVELVLSSTDQAYATPVQPTAYQVSLVGGSVRVPVVPGAGSSTAPPAAPLIGIGLVLGGCLLLGLFGMLRRRRGRDLDPGLVDVPLVIENLSKSYPGGVKAVTDLSFEVPRGQVLGLLGPNGAGKTTTLRMAMGLIAPTGGNIRVFGHAVYPGAPVLSRIGSFVEGSGFLPHLSGQANLELYWAATGRPAEHAHVVEALEIAGLGDAVNRKVRTYSQGMRQRLAIAQAMLGLPDLLVLDEPTNGLDPPQIHQMRAVLRRYADTGRTVLVSSHLLAEVEQTADHVVVMHRGKLVAEGKVDVIVAGGGQATFRVDRPDEAARVLGELAGVSEVVVAGDSVHADLEGMPRSAALAALVSAGIAVEQAGPRRRLEDAFLQLVGEEQR